MNVPELITVKPNVGVLPQLTNLEDMKEIGKIATANIVQVFSNFITNLPSLFGSVYPTKVYEKAQCSMAIKNFFGTRTNVENCAKSCLINYPTNVWFEFGTRETGNRTGECYCSTSDADCEAINPSVDFDVYLLRPPSLFSSKNWEQHFLLESMTEGPFIFAELNQFYICRNIDVSYFYGILPTSAFPLACAIKEDLNALPHSPSWSQYFAIAML